MMFGPLKKCNHQKSYTSLLVSTMIRHNAQQFAYTISIKGDHRKEDRSKQQSKKMIRFLIVIIIFSCKTESQKIESGETELASKEVLRTELQFSSRVDTTKKEVNDVLKLYENYINSHPDSIYDNPYWNSTEKALYKDFDFSRINIFNGLSSRQIFRIYTPYVLSIEPKNEKYQIRVLYSNSATEPNYIGSKVWCIHKLNATREKGVWKLENLMVEETKNWSVRQVGFIKYIFPGEYKFNAERANLASVFCHQMMSRFNPEFKDSFIFYLANGIDGMGELENFDYIFSGVTTGKSKEGMILSSKGDEFYPHEFIHKILPVNENRGDVIEEGLATFLGTKENREEYLSMMQKLANDFNERATYTLENILNDQVAWNGYQVAYPAGALICEVIHELKGDVGLNQLARGKANGYDEIMHLTQDILQLDENKLKQIIEKKLTAFK